MGLDNRFSDPAPQAAATTATGASRRDRPARWEHFAHGADVGIRGIAPTVAGAFAEAARALIGAMLDPDEVMPETAVEIDCAGADSEDLLYAWLNAVVYEMATRRMLFGRFEVRIDGRRLHAVAWGEPVSAPRHAPAVEVKGATMTALAVRRQDGEWIAECVVDV